MNRDDRDSEEQEQAGGPRLAPVSLGFEFAAAVMGGCFAGVWIDRHYETAPWGTVGGATVGLIGGFYNFLRSSIKAFRRAESASGIRTEKTSGIRTEEASHEDLSGKAAEAAEVRDALSELYEKTNRDPHHRDPS